MLGDDMPGVHDAVNGVEGFDVAPRSALDEEKVGGNACGKRVEGIALSDTLRRLTRSCGQGLNWEESGSLTAGVGTQATFRARIVSIRSAERVLR